MKVNVEEISLVKKKVNVEIPEEDVTKEIDSFYKDLGKTAKIKGFRPGKVPRNILEATLRTTSRPRSFRNWLRTLIRRLSPRPLSNRSLIP